MDKEYHHWRATTIQVYPVVFVVVVVVVAVAVAAV